MISDSYRCILYSARGVFPSDVPEDQSYYSQDTLANDIADLAAALGVDRFHLVGLSMGSFTSLVFALRSSASLISLTLEGCSSGPSGDVETRKYREDVTARIEALDQLRGDGAVRWLLHNRPGYRRMPLKRKSVWDAYCDNLRAQSVQGARNILSTVHWNRPSLYDREDELRRLDIPVLLVYGGEDFHLVEPTNRFLHSVLPSSEMVKFEEAGHLVHLEEPETFGRALRLHLDSAEASAATSNQFQTLTELRSLEEGNR